MGRTDLVEIRLPCLLQLLEEQSDLFHVSTQAGSHAQDDADSLSPDLHVSATEKLVGLQGKLENLHLVKI